MVDPLAQVATLLQPSALYSKIATGSGPWSARRSKVSDPLYLAIVEGGCCLSLASVGTRILTAGDVVLIPSPDEFVLSSLESAGPEDAVPAPKVLPNGELRVGRLTGDYEVKILLGYCVFRAADAEFLIKLLPRFLHIRGQERLTTLVRLIVEESHADRAARELVLNRLLEVLFIEALRSVKGETASPGLSRGLADARISTALKLLHEAPEYVWTVPELARRTNLSRSAFFDAFRQAIGLPPMEYLLNWRMALAKGMLLRNEHSVGVIAESVGYRSASSFSVAFRREVGIPPSQYVAGIRSLQPGPLNSDV